MRRACLGIGLVLCLSAFRCSLPWGKPDGVQATILFYNCHNLFDDVRSGFEYPEFDPQNGEWSSELYRRRLANTAEAVRSLLSEGKSAPDILCLAEVESEKVFRDLAEGPFASAGYRWMAVGGPDESPIRCGLLSRYPVAEARFHSVYDAPGQGGGRQMVEAVVDLRELARGDTDAGGLVSLFICHWKSRREGAAETEAARRAASALLASRLAAVMEEDPDRAIVVCGDFNESPDEFERVGRSYPTALMPDPDELAGSPAPGGAAAPAWFASGILVRRRGGAAPTPRRGNAVSLYSPWFASPGYSYVYDGARERYDGFLVGDALMDGSGLEFIRFEVADDPSLLDESGVPKAWDGSGGYSDHLPVVLSLGAAGG